MPNFHRFGGSCIGFMLVRSHLGLWCSAASCWAVHFSLSPLDTLYLHANVHSWLWPFDLCTYYMQMMKSVVTENHVYIYSNRKS